MLLLLLLLLLLDARYNYIARLCLLHKKSFASLALRAFSCLSSQALNNLLAVKLERDRAGQSERKSDTHTHRDIHRIYRSVLTKLTWFGLFILQSAALSPCEQLSPLSHTSNM